MNTNIGAKKILIYGDSLVFGWKPGGPRYDVKTRFTAFAQDILGSNYDIIEEGLRGRMLGGENSFFPYRNGLEQFGPILASHIPVDVIVLYLGTNDCNAGTNLDYEYISHSFSRYRETIQYRSDFFKLPSPLLLLVCPHLIQEENSYTMFKDIFKGSTEKSKNLVKYYQTYATETTIPLLDTSSLVTPSLIDGIHLDEEMNTVLGKELARFIQNNT